MKDIEKLKLLYESVIESKKDEKERIDKIKYNNGKKELSNKPRYIRIGSCPSHQMVDFITYLKNNWKVDVYDIKFGNKVVKDISLMKKVDQKQLQELITYFIRGEKFCDGFWNLLFDIGFVAAFIERLEKLQPINE